MATTTTTTTTEKTKTATITTETTSTMIMTMAVTRNGTCECLYFYLLKCIIWIYKILHNDHRKVTHSEIFNGCTVAVNQFPTSCQILSTVYSKCTEVEFKEICNNCNSFTISEYGSSCNALSLLFFLIIFISIRRQERMPRTR